MATEAAAWDMVEEVWVWEEAMELVVVEAMGSQQEVEATEVEEEELCTEEVWVEVQGPW